MALTLPYPTLSAAFTPTGSTVDVFSSSTVHSDSTHNNPHAKLLANDVAIKGAIDTLQTQVASISNHEIVWLEKRALIYQAGSQALPAFDGNPSEYTMLGATNQADFGLWKTVSYPDVTYIPSSGVQSIIVRCAAATLSWTSCHVKLWQSSPVGGKDPILGAWSYSRANSDDAASDTNNIELPYNSLRQVMVFWKSWSGFGNQGYFNLWVHVVGYRTNT